MLTEQVRRNIFRKIKDNMATKLDISQLDFDGIKDNLKTFLKQQDEFTDYDFEGSGMNILLDVLVLYTLSWFQC